MHTLLALTLSLLAPAQTEVHLRTLAGETLSGKLLQFNEREIVIDAGGEQKFTPAQLATITVNDAASVANWSIQVNLVDGSGIYAASFAVAGEKAQITLTAGTRREIPLAAIASVRFREQSNALAKQWGEYLAEEATADRLIIRRKAKPEAGGEESLDVLEGIVREVNDTTVNFDSGGLLKVKRERIDGLIYFRGREKTPPPAAFTLYDIDGSAWQIKTLALAEESVQLVTPAGLSVELPLTHLRQIDFASSNRSYLSELKSDSLIRTTWLSGEANTAAFAPLVDRTPQGAISIGGEHCSHALWMPAKSALIVRVPQGFTRFRTHIGIDDRVGKTDGARLLIEADGKTLHDKVYSRTTQLVPLEIDLAGARRVRITVDYGGTSFVGDQLVLCEAMFVK